MDEKYEYDVLLEIKASRRQVKATCSPQEFLDELASQSKLIDQSIKIVVDLANYVPSKDEAEKPFILQRYSSQWQSFVDVIDPIEIGFRDTLKLVPFPQLSPQSQAKISEVIRMMHGTEKWLIQTLFIISL